LPHAAALTEIGAVLLGLAIVGRLAGRIGLSPVPFYLLAGLAFGRGGLLPLDASEAFVATGAEIGAVLLLFSLGLEYSAAELTHTLRTSKAAGALDAALNFTPGLLAGLALGWGFRTALLMGGVTWVSSSGVAAKLLADLGRIGNRETPAILSILVIEDLAMACYLPLMAGLLAEGSGVAVAGSLAVSLAALVGAAWVALRHGEKLSERVFVHSDEMLLLTVLGLTLLAAGLAEAARLSAGVGAFLVGIALSGRAADGARALTAPLRDLFAGVFFVFFGLSVDPTDLPPALAIAALLTAVSVGGKLATGWWAAGRLGSARTGRLRAGATLVAHGEFSVVIAGIGIAAGAESDLAAVTAAYVLMTSVVGPILAKTVDVRTPPAPPPPPPTPRFPPPM
jgi:CPA2 family monovalent cation:H+ antiporter-2